MNKERKTAQLIWSSPMICKYIYLFHFTVHRSLHEPRVLERRANWRGYYPKPTKRCNCTVISILNTKENFDTTSLHEVLYIFTIFQGKHAQPPWLVCLQQAIDRIFGGMTGCTYTTFSSEQWCDDRKDSPHENNCQSAIIHMTQRFKKKKLLSADEKIIFICQNCRAARILLIASHRLEHRHQTSMFPSCIKMIPWWIVHNSKFSWLELGNFQLAKVDMAESGGNINDSRI